MKARQDALEWLVRFANMELETITPGDKAKLLVEAERHLWPVEELREFQAVLPAAKLPELGRMAWATQIPPKESQEYWSAILHAQKTVWKIFADPVIRWTTFPTKNSAAPRRPHPSTVAWGNDEVLWWVGKGYKSSYAIKFLRITGSQDDYLQLKILVLLDGLPQHAIRECPGCNKLFLNPTERKREFCSPKCQWRVNAKKKRTELKEKHPKEYEAYLQKQKARMSERYEREQKKKHGEKVRIARRGRT
jgi:hypothetical protein